MFGVMGVYYWRQNLLNVLWGGVDFGVCLVSP